MKIFLDFEDMLSEDLLEEKSIRNWFFDSVFKVFKVCDPRSKQVYICLGDDFENFPILFLDLWIQKKRSGSSQNSNNLWYMKLSKNTLNMNI